jgi:hypothetical protein
MKIFLDFNAIVVWRDIFKPMVGNHSLRENSNDNGIMRGAHQENWQLQRNCNFRELLLA